MKKRSSINTQVGQLLRKAHRNTNTVPSPYVGVNTEEHTNLQEEECCGGKTQERQIESVEEHRLETVEELLLRAGRAFVFDKQEYLELTSSRWHMAMEHWYEKCPDDLSDEITVLTRMDLLGSPKAIPVRGIQPHVPDKAKGSSEWLTRFQWRLRCKPYPEILQDGKFFPYQYEIRNKLPYFHVLSDKNKADTDGEREWKSSIFYSVLINALKERSDHLRDIDTIYCFGRGFSCFETYEQHGRKEQSFVCRYILGAAALNIALLRKQSAERLREPQILPRIKIVGLDYCEVCRLTLRGALQGTIEQGGLFQDDRFRMFFSTEESFLCYATEMDFVKDFGLRTLIICWDAEDPIYQLVADLSRQGEGPGAFLDGFKLPRPSVNNLADRNPRCADFDKIMGNYTSDIIYGPSVNDGEAHRWEQDRFPGTKWTLHVAEGLSGRGRY
jgi:hypothetical protein